MIITCCPLISIAVGCACAIVCCTSMATAQAFEHSLESFVRGFHVLRGHKLYTSVFKLGRSLEILIID